MKRCTSVQTFERILAWAARSDEPLVKHEEARVEVALLVEHDDSALQRHFIILLERRAGSKLVRKLFEHRVLGLVGWPK